MARTGPNQDINDLTFLELLRESAEIVSVKCNDYQNAADGKTTTKAINPSVHPDNIRIIPITTLLKKIDGSEIEISGFTTSGTYKQSNLDLYSESVINTHIFQPERFRESYNELVAIINSWSDRDNGSPISSTFISHQIVTSGVPIGDHQGWAETNIRIVQKDGIVVPNGLQIPVEIDWEGTGPTNYTSGTYSQLVDVFGNIISEMTESIQPYFDVTDVLSRGSYTGADQTDGFSVSLELFERADWDSLEQNTAQVSRSLPSHSSLTFPILIGSQHLLRIPILVSNFTDNLQNILYNIKLTMTPRNASHDIFTVEPGFVNKRILLVGHRTNNFDSIFIAHNGDNTTEVNNALTSVFSLQLTDFFPVPKKSLDIVTVQVYFVNQLSIRSGSFSGWETEDLLCDINIEFTTDGHSINEDFDPGIELDMWTP